MNFFLDVHEFISKEDLYIYVYVDDELIYKSELMKNESFDKYIKSPTYYLNTPLGFLSILGILDFGLIVYLIVIFVIIYLYKKRRKNLLE